MTYQEYEKKRNELGLTNGRVAKFSGVSTATLSQWKNGQYEPKPQTLAKIKKVLDTYKPEQILDYYDPEPKRKPLVKPLALYAQHLQPHDFTAQALNVQSYFVMLSDRTEIELTLDEYRELADDVAIYVNAWLKSHGKTD